VATAATLLLGLATSAAGFGNVLSSVSVARFGDAESAAEEVSKLASKLKSDYSGEEGKNKTLQDAGETLVGALKGREYWLEVYKAIDECLPRDTDNKRDESDPSKMDRVSIRSITTTKYDDLSTWFNDPVIAAPEGSAKLYSREDKDPETGTKSALAAAKPEYEINDRSVGPTGAGYVFTLDGVHYHHEEKNPKGKAATYVAEKFLKNLQSWAVKRESSSGGPPVETPVRLIGITHATMPEVTAPTQITFYPNRKSGAGAGSSMFPGLGAGNPYGGGDGGPGFGGPLRGGGATGFTAPGALAAGRPMPTGTIPGSGSTDDGAEKTLILQRTVFKVVFAWKPTPVSERKPWPVELTEAPPATGGEATGQTPPAQ
jgi:type IV pilus assembly protein PilM